MRPANVLRLALLAALLVAAGCSSNNKGKIEGTKWSSVATTMGGQAIPEGTAQLDFRSDGSLVYVTPDQTYTGTYSLGRGDYVTLNLKQDLAGRKTHVQKITVNGANLILKDSDGTQVTFSKVN